MNKALSPKLKKFLDFIQRFTLVNGQSPSYEEIMSTLGFGSLGTVNWYVKTLEEKGHLSRIKGPNGKRALILNQNETQTTTIARLPLLGLIAAGEPIEALENPEMVDVPPSLLHPDHYVLQVKGNSMIEEQIHDDVRALVDLLPDDQRQVVKMRHYMGMSFKDIAESTNVSINTALGRMRYALINLRKLIEEKDIMLTVH